MHRVIHPHDISPTGHWRTLERLDTRECCHTTWKAFWRDYRAALGYLKVVETRTRNVSETFTGIDAHGDILQIVYRWPDRPDETSSTVTDDELTTRITDMVIPGRTLAETSAAITEQLTGTGLHLDPKGPVCHVERSTVASRTYDPQTGVEFATAWTHTVTTTYPVFSDAIPDRPRLCWCHRDDTALLTPLHPGAHTRRMRYLDNIRGHLVWRGDRYPETGPKNPPRSSIRTDLAEVTALVNSGVDPLDIETTFA